MGQDAAPCISDVNGDGQVGVADVLQTLGSYGTGCPTGQGAAPCSSDVNGDGQVGVDDVLQTLGSYGAKGCSTAVVGEPLLGVRSTPAPSMAPSVWADGLWSWQAIIAALVQMALQYAAAKRGMHSHGVRALCVATGALTFAASTYAYPPEGVTPGDEGAFTARATAVYAGLASAVELWIIMRGAG